MAYTTIDDPSAYFQTHIYTGNNSASGQTITFGGNSDLQPDLTWIKCRNSSSFNHYIVDSSRGENNSVHLRLVPNGTQADGDGYTDNFSSDGFRCVNDNGTVNGNQTYVSWNWKCNGGTTSSNTEGTETTTIQVNNTAGFSIITYTGDGSTSSSNNGGHGLDVTPRVVIVKYRAGSGESWYVFHKSLGDDKHIGLNHTGAVADANVFNWDGSIPTATTFPIRGSGTQVNASEGTYVAYCFSEVQGYSKFGSYTGNGSTDGPFVYTGFKPAWVMIKRTSGTENWVLWDNKRDPFNNFYHVLLPNATSAEDTSNAGSGGRYVGDFLSNGFKVRTSSGSFNQNATTTLYIAFAESPFVSSEGVPTTAR